MTMSLDRKLSKLSTPISINNIITRKKQIETWQSSATARESVELKHSCKIKFSRGISFYSACANGDLEEAEILIRDGVNINCTNFDGLTPLHQACIDENLEVIEFLLNNGCDTNAQDVEGWTPLHAASSCECVEVVELLLSRDADPSITNNDNELAVDLSEDEDIIEILMKAMENKVINADIARDREHQLMLEDAAKWRRIGSVDFNNYVDNKTLATPLHVAAAKNYTDVMEILLACKGINLEAKDKDGWTALHAAAHWGHKDSARLLCEAGSNIDAASLHGQTPVDVANNDVIPFIRQLKEKYGVKLRRREQYSGRHEVKSYGIGRRSSVIRHSMIEKKLTRMQKEPSPMAMLMENLMLKKTLSGLSPIDKKEDPQVNSQERQSTILTEYRQKMLSILEASRTTRTPSESHDSECCIHGSQSSSVSVSTSSRPQSEEAVAKKPQSQETVADKQQSEETVAKKPQSQETVADKPQSEETVASKPQPETTTVREHHKEATTVNKPQLEGTTCNQPQLEGTTCNQPEETNCNQPEETTVTHDTMSSSEEETTSLDDLDDGPPVTIRTEHRQTLPESSLSSITTSVSSGGIRVVSNYRSSAETGRNSSIPEDEVGHTFRMEPSVKDEVSVTNDDVDQVMNESLSTFVPPKLGVRHLVNSYQSRSSSTGSITDEVFTSERNSTEPMRSSVSKIIQKSTSTPPPISPKPPKEKRKSQSGVETEPKRVSTVLSPVQSQISEAQRISKSRQALANRRSTQGEVFDDTVFEKSDASLQMDYKSLCEQLEEELRTLRNKMSLMEKDHEVQIKTIKELSKSDAYQARINELEAENSTLKHEKALEELRVENGKLKEENASLIRVIAKLSTRNTADGEKNHSTSDNNNKFSSLSTCSGRSPSPVHIITRL